MYLRKFFVGRLLDIESLIIRDSDQHVLGVEIRREEGKGKFLLTLHNGLQETVQQEGVHWIRI